MCGIKRVLSLPIMSIIHHDDNGGYYSSDMIKISHKRTSTKPFDGYVSRLIDTWLRLSISDNKEYSELILTTQIMVYHNSILHIYD